MATDAGPAEAASSPEPGPPQRGLSVGLIPLILSIVGTIVVAALVTLIYLSGRDAPEPAATMTSAATDVVAITGRPNVTVSAGSQNLMYVDITYDGALEGDRYRVVVMSGHRDGDPDAEEFDNTRFVTLPAGENQYRVSVAPGVELCAHARVVRGAAESAWSEPRCEVQRE